MSDYAAFLERKDQLGGFHGFDPIWMPDFLFDFQAHLVEWAIRRGRAALFEDCGLGKTPQALVWAENVVRHTNRPVLILAPLAVSHQFVTEGEKFGIECKRVLYGKVEGPGIYVTNYEKLHHFDQSDFVGVIADESSILKNFDGKTRTAVTEFMRRIPYRLLGTATASPNDFIELGTSSEALGELGHMDMLGMFFKNDDGNSVRGRSRESKWRFKGYSEGVFWRWVCSWARACRKPSDVGFDDRSFELPPLIENEIIVQASRPMDGYLFTVPAVGLKEQRSERRHTIQERCEVAADKANSHKGHSVLWCHLNDEGDLLTKLTNSSMQIKGSMRDEEKEDLFEAFRLGQLENLVIKPKIGGFGLNWQHCHHMTMFPSHSFEQYYQSIRRCLRFGQEHPVIVDVITTEGEDSVLKNLRRKASQADVMFDHLVEEMRNELTIKRRQTSFSRELEVPSWM